ncbi:MAG: GNAT family N-acetyltransferase [Eubacteriales bacterium]|nr:GNAT family N-acetyltransferase [Eubacteriales bacterium]
MGQLKYRTGRLRRRDYKKALEFTVEGMQVDKYSDSRFFQYLYGIYFLYMEMEHTTDMLSVYEDDQLVGLLMIDMKGRKKKFHSFCGGLIVRVTEFLMGLAAGNGANSYGEANEAMLKEFQKRSDPDGEMNFLAVDRELRGKGIGGKMVKLLRKREPGKLLYLYTDNNCIYQFYDRKGFTREETREIEMEIQGKRIPLTCMLYAIQL